MYYICGPAYIRLFPLYPLSRWEKYDLDLTFFYPKMNTGIIYLIQPAELVGTHRYKVGLSNKPNLDRCIKGYKNGSRYLCIMEIASPLTLEKNIKEYFTKKFKLAAGSEYFESSEENEIISEFLQKVLEYKNVITGKRHRLSENKSDIPEIGVNDICLGMEEIITTFEDWKEDMSFGGKKFLARSKLYKDKICIEYIHNQKLERDFVTLDPFADYLHSLIKNGVLADGKTYDLNSVKFLKELDQYKSKIEIESWDYIEKIIASSKKIKQNPFFRVRCNLFSNAILNKAVYCDYKKKLGFVELNFSTRSNGKNEKFFVISIGGKNYDSYLLRLFTPFRISINDKENSFYMVNKDNQHIGICKTSDLLTIDRTEELLDKDDYPPWSRYQDKREITLKKMEERFFKITSGLKCLNMNANTFHILKLLFKNF
jgi:hypothetical protein